MPYFRTLLLSVSVLLPFFISAQPFEALIPIEESLGDSSEVAIFSDENGGILFVREGNSALVLALDRELRVKKQFRIFDLPPLDSHLRLGYTYKRGQLYIAYLDRKTKEYKGLSIFPDEESSRFSAIDMSRLSRGSVFWGTFTYEGILHIVRLPRGQASIRLCRFEGGEEFSAQEYPVLKDEFVQGMRDNLTRIDAENPPSLEKTYLPGKLYHYEDQLYLTLDDRGQTHVVHINLKTGLKDEFTLEAPGFQDSLTKSNSLILQDKIFQLAMSRDSVHLLVRELNSDKVLRSLLYDGRDEWEFQRGAMVLEDKNGQTKQLSDRDSFLTHAYDMPYLGMGADLIADTLAELTFGAVRPTLIKGITGMILKTDFEKVYFSTLLNTRDLFPLLQLPEALANRRFPPPLFKEKPHFQTFKWEGKPYFGYYDRENGGFYLSR